MVLGGDRELTAGVGQNSIDDGDVGEAGGEELGAVGVDEDGATDAAYIGGERVGDRVARVIVGMDAETFAGNDARDLADDALDLMRKRSAVGVA